MRSAAVGHARRAKAFAAALAFALVVGSAFAETVQSSGEAHGASPDGYGSGFASSELPASDVSAKLQAHLFDAARRGDLAILKEFIAAKYDLDRRDAKGYTALILSAYHGHEEAVRLLLDAGANPCAEDLRGNTALMGAIFKAEIGVARLLMKAGCDPDQRNAAGQTPAMYAALFGRLEVLNTLKAQGADLQAADKVGNTAEGLAQGVIVQSTGR